MISSLFGYDCQLEMFSDVCVEDNKSWIPRVGRLLFWCKRMSYEKNEGVSSELDNAFVEQVLHCLVDASHLPIPMPSVRK